MAATAFGNAIEFMHRLGVFDVVLPFLLVFSLVFAFLEKTKVLGTDIYISDDTKQKYQIPRKNMNSMIAFVTAFFVVASTKLVALISQIMSQIVLVLILVFSFTLVVGAFRKEEEQGFGLDKGWATAFMIITAIAIAFIFLNALGWLDAVFNFFNGFWGSDATASIILIALIIGFIAFITADRKPSSNKKAEGSK